MNTATNQKGFSIIEVVLVLAIAGLIFLMVFIALPALQRNQRDSAKQTEVGAVVSAIGTYQSANNGAMPKAGADGAKRIAGIISGDSSSNKLDSGTAVRDITTFNSSNATFSVAADGAENAAGSSIGIDDIVVVTGAKCPSESTGTVTLEPAGRRQAAVMAALESGVIYCRNS